MKKLIKGAQAWTVVTGVIAVLYFLGRFGYLEHDQISIRACGVGCILSALYIAFMVIIYKYLASIEN